MTRLRTAKAYRLTGGPTVVLAELRPHEVINAWRASGGDSPMERSLTASIEALKMAIRQIDGREVTYQELEVGLRKLIPRTRQRMRLAQLLGDLHAPTEEELRAALDSMEAELDGDAERWRVALPGGRHVLLAELDEQTVGSSLAHAEREARGGDAQELLASIQGLRLSLREIDGAPVVDGQLAGTKWDETFTMRETTLLRRVFNEVHIGGAEEVPLGEGKPVSGTL